MSDESAKMTPVANYRGVTILQYGEKFYAECMGLRDTIESMHAVIDAYLHQERLRSSVCEGRLAFLGRKKKVDLLAMAEGDGEILTCLEVGFRLASESEAARSVAREAMAARDADFDAIEAKAATGLNQMIADLEEGKITLEGTRALRAVTQLKLMVALLEVRVARIEGRLGLAGEPMREHD